MQAIVSDIAIFVLKRDVKLQLTNMQATIVISYIIQHTKVLLMPTTITVKSNESVIIRPHRRTTYVESICRCGWLRGPAVEHQSLAGVLSLSCARPVANG